MKFLALLFFPLLLLAAKPELFLLQNYSEDINVTHWYMSEKLDGVRAFWDGEKLLSRSGKVFAAPEFFTENFPEIELDGELWSRRGDFSNISSIVNRKKPHESWSELTYNVFEVPHAKGGLLHRLSKVKESKYIRVIEQRIIKSKQELRAFLREVEQKGGEGVVVRDASLAYYTGRNKGALKVKSYNDTECEVKEHLYGKGKYENMLGAIVCEMQSGKLIRIGSGFSDKERIEPPKIGAIITFKYYGLTSKGNPRFPIYLRERR